MFITYAYTPITLHANGKDSLKFKEALEMTSSHRFNWTGLSSMDCSILFFFPARNFKSKTICSPH